MMNSKPVKLWKWLIMGHYSLAGNITISVTEFVMCCFVVLLDVARHWLILYIAVLKLNQRKDLRLLKY